MNRFRAPALLLLLAVLLAGVAHVAALPPFEGYDETAHWSSIQQIADTGHLPVYGRDRLSADLARYAGPWASDHGQPYRAWFDRHPAAAAVVQGGPGRFGQGQERNWQAQHPPLFYLLLAPVYRLAAGLDWRWHLFVLRLAGWVIAWAGFAWGAWRTQQALAARGVADARLLLPAAWPFLFPQFFPEMARLTNDTLCLLLFAGVWSVALAAAQHGLGRRGAVGLGLLLGAGLLTKAFFLPVAAGTAVLLGLVAWQRRDAANARALALTLVVAALLGGPWYGVRLLSTGSLTGADEFIRLAAAGGFWQGLAEHLSLLQAWRGLVGILGGFAWGGTWSFAHPRSLFVAPLVLAIVLAAVLYAWGLRRRDAVALAPLCLVGPVLAGLVYHVLWLIAGTGEGAGTPGWYLHIFAAPLALMLALGWRWPWLQGGLAAYGIAFGAAMVPWQLAFFSGCLARAGVGAVTLAGARCVVDVAHLQAISLPGLALAAGVPGLLALLAAAALTLRAQRGRAAASRPALHAVAG